MKTIKHGDTWFIDDDNYDYSVEIQKAVDAGDFAKAAYLEKSRNAKIDRFVMPYEKTYLYQDYLPKVGKAAESVSGASTTQVPSIGDSDYAKKMNSALNKLGAMNFHYNANNDPLYKQIKQNYQNTVNDVIDNTMGSYAGMTGGMPSSFATSAAAQAGAQHLQKADDMISELYQLAYNKFSDDKADLYKQFGIMQGLEEQAYSREWDKKSWDYQLEQDEKANALAEAKAQNDYEVSLAEIEAEVLKEGNDMQKQYFDQAMKLVEIGTPPSDETMELIGLDMTGQQFYDNYVTESNRVLAEKNKYSSKVTSEPKEAELKKPTDSMFSAIDKIIEDGGDVSEIERKISHYDGDEYDLDMLYDYAETHGGYDFDANMAKNYAEKVNNYYKKKRNDDYVALIPNDDGTYKLGELDAKYLIKYVYEDESLTEEEASMLLYDYFGITEKQVNDALH